jgi:hypothetical protein
LADEITRVGFGSREDAFARHFEVVEARGEGVGLFILVRVVPVGIEVRETENIGRTAAFLS